MKIEPVVFNLRSLEFMSECMTELPDGRYVISRALNYHGLWWRIRAAWEVLRGRAFPVEWR